jgi:CBS-domain-containing membrane protein
MKAVDMMTSNVVTIAPDASVRDAAWTMLTQRISALPVVDGHGGLLGIVSEGDLLHRVEAGTERQRSWWSAFNASSEVLADEYVRSHARKVSDVMTTTPVTVPPEASAADVADLMEKHGIKRVPVVSHDKLVGIVSRSDFLTALTGARPQLESMATADDALRGKIVSQFRAMLWARPAILNVAVHEGVVELSGIVESEAQKRAARVTAEETPGVHDVEDHIKVQRIATLY